MTVKTVKVVDGVSYRLDGLTVNVDGATGKQTTKENWTRIITAEDRARDKNEREVAAAKYLRRRESVDAGRIAKRAAKRAAKAQKRWGGICSPEVAGGLFDRGGIYTCWPKGMRVPVGLSFALSEKAQKDAA